jgi:hypothetical protein
MTIGERIVALLQRRPDGVDDDELSDLLGLKARQQANSRCRQLTKEGVVVRHAVNGKIRNFWSGQPIPDTSSNPPSHSKDSSRQWFWEGNVQAQLVRYLSGQNYRIRSVADTLTKQRGIDIVAERNGEVLWISVKGYPAGTDRTPPSTQAGHWFKQAIFDVLSYRGQDKSVSLGVGLPDYKRYRALSSKIDWLRPIADFRYFWVEETGVVSVD